MNTPVMRYLVNGKRKFETLAEAIAYANVWYEKKGVIVSIAHLKA